MVNVCTHWGDTFTVSGPFLGPVRDACTVGPSAWPAGRPEMGSDIPWTGSCAEQLARGRSRARWAL